MPTLLIDEGDFKDSDETQEIIKYFLLGFEKGNRIFNCNKNDPNKLEFYDPYCPKIITRRRQFKDQALEARNMTEIMRQTNRKDIAPLLTNAFYEKQRVIRNKCLKFRFDYWHRINIDEASKIDLGDVEPRIKQASLPFTPLFVNIPGALEQFKKFIKQYNDKLIEDRSSSYDGIIVNTIINFILDEQKNITAKDIANKFEEWNIKGTSGTIGKHLRQLGIATESRKIDGKTMRVIPLNENFLGVVKRYCTDKNKLDAVTAVTDVTTVTDTSKEETEKQKTLPKDIDSKLKKEIDLSVSTVTSVTDVTEKTNILRLLDEDQQAICWHCYKTKPCGYSLNNDNYVCYDCFLKLEGKEGFEYELS